MGDPLRHVLKPPFPDLSENQDEEGKGGGRPEGCETWDRDSSPGIAQGLLENWFWLKNPSKDIKGIFGDTMVSICMLVCTV